MTNCVLDSRCQGIRIGCPSDDTIRNCRFSNIVFRGEGSGIRCENPYRYLRQNCEGYLKVSDLSFENFDIDSGVYPIRINVEGGIRLRAVERISFRNIRIRAKRPVSLEGNGNTPLTDIRFSGISGVVEGDVPLFVRNVSRLKLDDFELTAVTGEPETFVRQESSSWETKF